MSQNKTLQHILDAVYRMAARKQRANLERKDGREICGIATGTVGVTSVGLICPMRINERAG